MQEQYRVRSLPSAQGIYVVNGQYQHVAWFVEYGHADAFIAFVSERGQAERICRALHLLDRLERLFDMKESEEHEYER